MRILQLQETVQNHSGDDVGLGPRTAGRCMVLLLSLSLLRLMFHSGNQLNMYSLELKRSLIHSCHGFVTHHGIVLQHGGTLTAGVSLRGVSWPRQPLRQAEVVTLRVICEDPYVAPASCYLLG